MKGVYTFEIGDLWISVVTDGDKTLLVDCGYPGDGDKIAAAMRGIGLDPEKITCILITHHDEDHRGDLRRMTELSPEAVVYSSEIEKPYLLGEKKAMRLVDAEAEAVGLSGSDLTENLAYRDLISGIRPVFHVETVRDGDVLPLCGGVEIIATPGHMPGHISAYVRGTKTLIPGDAISRSEDGKLFSDPTYAYDLPESVRSAQKLMQYDIESVRCYHGGVFEGDVRAALEDLVREQGSGTPAQSTQE